MEVVERWSLRVRNPIPNPMIKMNRTLNQSHNLMRDLLPRRNKSRNRSNVRIKTGKDSKTWSKYEQLAIEPNRSRLRKKIQKRY